jgi:hypothetical protein
MISNASRAYQSSLRATFRKRLSLPARDLSMTPATLNEVYTKPSMRRRYEVWFLKLQLADRSGAWWLRYLIMNLGRDGGGCPGNPPVMPAQVWVTWFPAGQKPHGLIEGFPKERLDVSARGVHPFHLAVGDNRIDEDSCKGRIEAAGHTVTWDLRYRSNVKTTMSNVGWIGFSRTPHSDATFQGEIALDGRRVAGDPLGYGLQGHNCGFRHRNRWNWTHCLAIDENQASSSFEALEYEIGMGLKFRKAILWHRGELRVYRRFLNVACDGAGISWRFDCSGSDDESRLRVEVDGGGPSLHRVPYTKTDCSSGLEVANNSLATARMVLSRPGSLEEEITANAGAVLEMGGV